MADKKETQEKPRSVTEEQKPIVAFTRGPDGNPVPVEEVK